MLPTHIAPPRSDKFKNSRIIRTTARYDVCIVRVGLVVQHHSSGTGRLPPVNHSQYAAYVFVFRLRTSRGTYYIPGTWCTDWDGVTAYLDQSEIVPRNSDEDAHDVAIRDALCIARGIAEHEAEKCREEAARYDAELQIEAYLGDIAQARKRARDVVKELRSIALTPALCEMAKQYLTEARQEVREAVRNIAVLRKEIVK